MFIEICFKQIRCPVGKIRCKFVNDLRELDFALLKSYLINTAGKLILRI